MHLPKTLYNIINVPLFDAQTGIPRKFNQIKKTGWMIVHIYLRTCKREARSRLCLQFAPIFFNSEESCIRRRFKYLMIIVNNVEK